MAMQAGVGELVTHIADRLLASSLRGSIRGATSFQPRRLQPFPLDLHTDFTKFQRQKRGGLYSSAPIINNRYLLESTRYDRGVGFDCSKVASITIAPSAGHVAQSSGEKQMG